MKARLPWQVAAMTASSKNRPYSRFIPREEVGAVTQWQFGAVDGSDAVVVEALSEPQVDEAERAAEEAAQQVRVQQASDEAYERGLAQGRDEATAEWQRRLDEYVEGQGREAAERLVAATEALQGTLDGMQQQVAQEVLQLACDIARQVVRQELRSNPDALAPVVKEALAMLVADGGAATVRLHPADYDQVGTALQATPATVQWIADAAVPPGGCLVDAAGTVVDGSLEKRWQRAVAPLGLDSAWSGGGDPEKVAAQGQGGRDGR